MLGFTLSHSRNAPAGYPGGVLIRRRRRIRVRCSVLHFRTTGRDEKGLAHLAILLRRVGAVAGDRGGGGGRWRLVGGTTPASGGIRPMDGSGLRRTEPRSQGGGRGVMRSRDGVARGGGGARRKPWSRGLARASHEEEEVASHEEEWARRDRRFGPTYRCFERRRVVVARCWQRGRPKTNVAPKSVHALFFLVVGDRGGILILLRNLSKTYF